MSLHKDGQVLPIYFTLKRNVQGFDFSSLENDDLAFNFDIKGSIYGRKELENPRDVLNFEVVL